MDIVTMGQRIRSARKMRGMNADELAARIGIKVIGHFPRTSNISTAVQKFHSSVFCDYRMYQILRNEESVLTESFG